MGILPRALACCRGLRSHRCAYATPRATGSVIELDPEDFFSELSDEAARLTMSEKEAGDEPTACPNEVGTGLAIGAAALWRRCKA